MPIAGTHMKDPNFRLRILLIVFGGTIAFASIAYWRTELLASQEYIEFPDRNNITAVTKTGSDKADAEQEQKKVRKDLQGYEDLY